jgi:molybdopterin synthase catalytic subunit/molybdopterin converting factor small subunit
MRVSVLGFAGVREIIGSQLELDLPEGSTVAALSAELENRFPALIPYRDRLAVAIDGELGTPDSPLIEGTEVALLPPVSGGSPEEAVALVQGPISVDSVSAAVAHPGSGAIVTFSGTVRDHHRGRSVTHLTYDAYEPMALAALKRIATEITAASENVRVAITHRLGEVVAGDASVVIAASSPHRAASYDASREALERLKREVPIWKQEHYADGESTWREEEPLGKKVKANQPSV